MIRMTLSKLAVAVGGELYGDDLKFYGVETDTRIWNEESAAAIFVALRGPNFDGHDFLLDAKKQGARAFLVSSLEAVPCGVSAVVVPDTTKALLAMASSWRNLFCIPMVCVAGSNGKTTVRSMIAAILREAYGDNGYLSTERNFNNHIGVPKVLFKLSPRHRVAVVEIGMNHPGEMHSLLKAIRPDVSLVTNTLREHMEFMRSLDNVAMENSLSYEMTSKSGTCIINHDDRFFPLYVNRACSRKQIWFGHKYNSHVSVRLISRNNDCQVVEFFYKNRCYKTQLQLVGKHNVMNAMAAFSAGLALDIDGEIIANALSKALPVSGRLNCLQGIFGSELIDDTYNANPDSTLAAIDVLVSSSRKRKFFVMGDMAEVGSFGKEFNQEVARYARSKGVSRLFLLGRSAQFMADCFGEGSVCCNDLYQLLLTLKSCLSDDVAVLIKGSRFMRMERIVAMLVAQGK